ncbi:MAG: MFS transporter [Bacteroidetes bacterium]|nr:MFS transporter [Bacteroidota bacterium]MCL5025468.1 MFS transporter [Chloroflexota bacterium]
MSSLSPRAADLPTESGAASRATLFTRDFVLVCLASFAHGTSFQLLLATMPLYVLALGGRETDVGLLMGLVSLSALAARPAAGWAVDAKGRKAVMLFGPSVFATASMAYGFITSVPALLALRTYHGLGIGTYTTGSTVYVGDQVPAPRRGEAMGFFGMSQNLAQAIGPAVGLAVLEAFGFHWLFALSVGLALLSVGLTTRLSDSFVPRGGRRLSWSMFFTARALRPTVLVFGMAFATGSIMSFVPLYGRSQGIGNPGFFFTIYALAMLLCRPTAGALSDRLGRMAVVTPGMLVIAFGLWALALSGQWWSLAASAVLLGVGAGTVYPALLALMMDVAGKDARGAAMSTFGIGMDVGIGVGSVLLGMIIEQAGFPVSFAVAGAVPLAMLLAYALVTWRRATPTPASSAADR